MRTKIDLIDDYVDINYSACVSSPARLPYPATLMVRDRCLCLHVQRAARALARRFDQAFKPFGLTNGQFSLLMALNRPEPPPMGPVASLLAMDRTTLTAALKPLERRALVRVAPSPSDRRRKVLVLTEDGHALLLRALPVWQQTHDEIDELLPGGGADLLRGCLAALG